MDIHEKMTRLLVAAGYREPQARRMAREIRRAYVRKLHTKLTMAEMVVRASDNMAVRW